jgi:benzoyl-CoA-dihydrodiol lyase
MGNGLTRLKTRFLDDDASVKQIDAARDRVIEAPRRPQARPRHLHARRHRLGGRGARGDRGARQLLARRPDRHGGQPALGRAPRRWRPRSSAASAAWQNWIFQRPNAVGDEGALKLYGTGRRADYKRERV